VRLVVVVVFGVITRRLVCYGLEKIEKGREKEEKR
jgi:hypothetical protein